MEDFSRQMTSNLFGNPHSASSSSQLSMRRVDDVRLRMLQFFNADADYFDLIFVANATAGMKLVMEAFREKQEGFWYGYHKDAHTSLVGIREAAKAGHHCFMSDEEVEDWLRARDSDSAFLCEDELALFAYPAQSNMNGRRLDLSWTGRLRSSKQSKNTFSLLDAAALVSTSPLDLGDPSQAPDFTVLSFYKIFGFPDLGALIVRKESGSILQRRGYFGGGTVEMVTCGKENWHVSKEQSLHDRLEDGSLPIHSIIALASGLDVLEKLHMSMECIASHAGLLAERLYEGLSALHHWNGEKVCEIYKDPSSSYSDRNTQGPIIAFNLINSRNVFISNSEVEKLAAVRNIQIRSGGLCNPGGIASSLGLPPWSMRRNFAAGQRCTGEQGIIDGKPTGMLRVSLGAMSNTQDVVALIDFVKEFFVDEPPIQGPHEQEENCIEGPSFYVESLTVYPIKSCGGWTVPSGLSWDIKQEGLAFDREWCLVHQGTRTTLSQKKYPKMALLRPTIDLTKGLLSVRFQGRIPPEISGEISVPLSADPRVFASYGNSASATPTSEVCGDEITADLYASPAIANFFTALVGTPCTLARFPSASPGLSKRHSKAHQTLITSLDINKHPILLSNESPILAISRSSVNRLNEEIKQRRNTGSAKAVHASVFRANLVVAEDHQQQQQAIHQPSMGEHPYHEDRWATLYIERRSDDERNHHTHNNNYNIDDAIKLDILGPCRRCQMLCVDQMTAEKNEEPLVTLAKTRRRQGKIFFGVHAALSLTEEGDKGAKQSQQSNNSIQVGDKLRAVVHHHQHHQSS